MKFRIADDRGQPLDANVELEPSAIVMLSRGGTAGSGNSQNQDYPTALRLILQRLRSSGREITGAWVDSGPARALPPAERQIYFPEDASADAKALFSLFGRRMERVAKAPDSIPNKGNRNKRLRIEVATTSIGELSAVVRAIADGAVPRSLLRLPARELRKVTAAHVWSAINRLRAGAVDHDFDDALEYELVTETGEALPPKAVFGLAASEALGFSVRPVHFTGGVGTVCFEMLETAGWPIVRKGAATVRNSDPLDEDREWAEGDGRRRDHLRRERHPGVARAKKAQMRDLHGKLFCEECGLDPVDAFGREGEACIEVHHNATEVSRMSSGHLTRLSDVQCLCANCHRIRHRRMKWAEMIADGQAPQA